MSKNDSFSIYALCDPDTQVPYYVGKSSNPKKRFRDHLNMINGKSLKKSWIISLKRKGKIPLLYILENGLSKESVNNREMFWIEHFRKLNPKLKNMTVGGDGGITHFGKPVSLECSNGKTYRSIKEASVDIGSSLSAISLVLSGKNITVKGLQFWKSGTSKPELRQKVLRVTTISCSNGKIYESIKKASLELQLSEDAISQCVRGIQNQTGGFSFTKIRKT